MLETLNADFAGTVMQQFDILAPVLVDQFVKAVKIQLNKPQNDLAMILIPKDKKNIAAVWAQLSEDTKLSLQSRLKLVDILLHLGQKWAKIFADGRRASLRSQVALWLSRSGSKAYDCDKGKVIAQSCPCPCSRLKQTEEDEA